MATLVVPTAIKLRTKMLSEFPLTSVVEANIGLHPQQEASQWIDRAFDAGHRNIKVANKTVGSNQASPSPEHSLLMRGLRF